MVVKVLVHGYATEVFSPRKIDRRVREDVAVRMLAARNFSAHRTMRDFRAFHLEQLSDLFVQGDSPGPRDGLVKLGAVAADGTKVKANASRHKTMSYAHMQGRVGVEGAERGREEQARKGYSGRDRTRP